MTISCNEADVLLRLLEGEPSIPELRKRLREWDPRQRRGSHEHMELTDAEADEAFEVVKTCKSTFDSLVAKLERTPEPGIRQRGKRRFNFGEG